MSSPCPVCGFDDRHLSPSDATVALHSLDRRYRGVLIRPDDDDRAGDVIHRRPPAGGRSAIEHAESAAAALAGAGRALESVLQADDATVDVPAPDDGTPSGPESTAAADDVVAAVDRAAGALASTAGGVSSREWARPARTPAGDTITALGVLTAGVHGGIHHLRQAEQAVTEALRSP